MGLLSGAQSWLTSTLRTDAGVTVTYSRTGQTSLTLTAMVGRTAFSQIPGNDAGGAAVIWGDRDYFVRVADLTYGEPRKGDRITEVINGVAVTFECQAPGGEPCWRYSDQERTLYRIHTKRVG